MDEAATTPPTQKKRGRPAGSKKSKSPAAKKSKSTQSEEYSLAELSAAKEIGLPSGWSAYNRGNAKWTIKSPEGKSYKSKKAAFAAAGLDIPAERRKKASTPKKRKIEEEGGEDGDNTTDNVDLDEGDPPWRTSGHQYLARRVRWTPPPDGGVASQPSVGTIVGWISEKDVDSEGNPGFSSSVTGNPANLFHAVFEDFSQDLEEFELEECLLEEEDDDEE